MSNIGLFPGAPLTWGAFVLALSATVAPATAQQSIEERRACTPDVIRLCREFVPNTELINRCLLEKKAELSPNCRTVMFGPETAPAATPVKQEPQSKPEQIQKPKPIRQAHRKVSKHPLMGRGPQKPSGHCF
jgi:hypothetical protein